MQDFERDAVPFPPLAGVAVLSLRRPRRRGCGDDGMIVRKRRDEPRHRHDSKNRQRAARVIGVGVTYDERVELGGSRGAQERDDDTPARIGGISIARTGIVEERMLRGGDQNRESLSDVEHDDAGATCMLA